MGGFINKNLQTHFPWLTTTCKSFEPYPSNISSGQTPYQGGKFLGPSGISHFVSSVSISTKDKYTNGIRKIFLQRRRRKFCSWKQKYKFESFEIRSISLLFHLCCTYSFLLYIICFRSQKSLLYNFLL